MYTQCPECETTFKLGAEDLRRARGKVRCGDCDHIFNALEYLAEDVEDEHDDAAIARTENDGWSTSSANPNGDLSPDLDEYEATAFIEDSDDDGSDAVVVEDTDDDDSDAPDFDDDDDADDYGAILHIAGDEEPATSTVASGGDGDGDGDNDSESLDTQEDVDFDDTIWERVPGVANEPDEVESWQREDDVADDEEDWQQETADEPDEAEDWQPEVAETAETLEAAPEQDLEFNVPAEKWNNFFGPLPKGQNAAVWQPPPLDDETAEDTEGNEAWDDLADEESSAAAPADEAAPESAIDDAPSWRDAPTVKSRGGLFFLGGIALVLALTAQLVHYNRDRLAAHESYGQHVRNFYASVNSELYPDWPVNNFEIRGSEAVAGETGRDVLDIRAQIANTGDTVVGLPRLRVVLRDRWSNPVAAQDFGPAEYGDLAPGELMQPGDMVNAHVSIQDPGSGAQGFELELCLPRRHTGLECTGQPFK